MSRPSTPFSIPQIPATTPSESSSNIEGIFEAALKSYKKKTKKDLKNHNLFKELESCDSPAAILAVFQAAQFDQSTLVGTFIFGPFVTSIEVAIGLRATTRFPTKNQMRLPLRTPCAFAVILPFPFAVLFFSSWSGSGSGRDTRGPHALMSGLPTRHTGVFAFAAALARAGVSSW